MALYEGEKRKFKHIIMQKRKNIIKAVISYLLFSTTYSFILSLMTGNFILTFFGFHLIVLCLVSIWLTIKYISKLY